MRSSVEEGADLIRESKRLVVITGAGISVASGLPMFRGTGPDAIWSQDDLEIATVEYYRRAPSGWWQWYFDRFAGLAEAEPNPAHYALAEMESWKTNRGESFLVVTQNIDTLHERAGTENLIKIHGTSERVRCFRTGCRRGAPAGSIPVKELDFSRFGSGRTEAIPVCPECGTIIRPHVLLFDEYYIEHHDYGFTRAQREIEAADVLMFVGTSFSVGITAVALNAALLNHISVMSVDPAGSAPRGSLSVELNAEDALPKIVERLKER